MLGRPAPLWILALLGLIGGLACTIVAMQFAEVIPWAGDEATYIGGRWTGVVVYGFTAAFFYASAYAWITVKPWAHMVSILAALIGFFVPFISHMDGTDPRSSAIAPLVVSVLMLFMVFRPSTNRAMAAALAGQTTSTSQKTPPPPKPMSAARKREVAAEQQKAKAQTPQPAAVAAAPVVATSPATPSAATAASVPAKSAAAMVLSAASSLKAAAATPASPRKGVTSKAPAAPRPTAASTANSAPQKVPALRADEV